MVVDSGAIGHAGAEEDMEQVDPMNRESTFVRSLVFERLELFDSQLFVLCDRRHWQSALVLGSVVPHEERFG